MWWLRLQSLAFVVAGALIIFFLSLAVILGPVVWGLIRPLAEDGSETRLVWVVARYALAVALLWGALMLLHHWLPNTKQAFRRILPGVCVTVVLWLVGATAFSFYVGTLADYSVIYGSLGGVAITLVFFYVTAVIFIFGAELNAFWRRCTGQPMPRQEVKPGET